MFHGDKGSDMINLRNLRRNDPHVVEILHTATAVGIYEYCRNPKQWNKMDIEGPLHVVRRSVHPKTMMIVTNRLSTKNLVEGITAGTDVSIQTPFLMIKSSQGVIYCIWFYSQEECQNTAKLIKEEIDKISNDKQSLMSPNNPPQDQKLTSIPYSPSSPATASLVDTLALIGIKKITVTKSVGGTPPVSTPQSAKSTSFRSNFSENGIKPADLSDLFVQASASEASAGSNSATSPSFMPNNFTSPSSVNILNRDPSKLDLVDDDEMLTPSRIREKSARDSSNISLSSSNAIPSSADKSKVSRSSEGTKNSGFTSSDSKVPMEELKKTLIHLIQTDSEFVSKIRDALLVNGLKG